MVGTYYLEQLDKVLKDIAIVGDIRGKGLMIGVEMVLMSELYLGMELGRVEVVLKSLRMHVEVGMGLG